jgi:ketosteroid isomerase-like protein
MAIDEKALRELMDREAIRSVYMRYARGLDRGDAELIASAYHPDATEDHHGEVYKGETIGQILADHVLTGMSRTHTNMTNLSITLNGDKAGCEAYYLGLHVMKNGGKRLMSAGRSLDKLEKRNGEWRFVYRNILPDMVRILQGDEIAIAGVVYDRSRADQSYEILGTGN